MAWRAKISAAKLIAALCVANFARAQTHTETPIMPRRPVMREIPVARVPVVKVSCPSVIEEFTGLPTTEQLVEAQRVFEAQMLRQNPNVARQLGQQAKLSVEVAATTPNQHEPSGDLYRVMTLPDGRISIVFGDVAGHGTKAGRHSLSFHNYFDKPDFIRNTMERGPAEAMAAMGNRRPVNNVNLALENFVYDPKTGRLDWVNAGMIPILVREASGEIRIIDKRAIYLFGGKGFVKYDAETFGRYSLKLNPGASVIALSDGMLEGVVKDSGKGVEEIFNELATNPNALNEAIPELRNAKPFQIAEILEQKIQTRELTKGDQKADVDDRTVMVLSPSSK